MNRASAAEDDFQRLSTNEDEVRRAFQHVNPNKATVQGHVVEKPLDSFKTLQEKRLYRN